MTELPPLAGARGEAAAVAELLRTKPLLGAAATESTVYENAGRIRWLHIAAHGQYVPQSPRFSRLLLTRGHGHDGDARAASLGIALLLGGFHSHRRRRQFLSRRAGGCACTSW